VVEIGEGFLDFPVYTKAPHCNDETRSAAPARNEMCLQNNCILHITLLVGAQMASMPRSGGRAGYALSSAGAASFLSRSPTSSHHLHPPPVPVRTCVCALRAV
jgi:hypothetical protein